MKGIELGHGHEYGPGPGIEIAKAALDIPLLGRSASCNDLATIVPTGFLPWRSVQALEPYNLPR